VFTNANGSQHVQHHLAGRNSAVVHFEVLALRNGGEVIDKGRNRPTGGNFASCEKFFQSIHRRSIAPKARRGGVPLCSLSDFMVDFASSKTVFSCGLPSMYSYSSSAKYAYFFAVSRSRPDIVNALLTAS
jgi:hypothetical protein